MLTSTINQLTLKATVDGTEIIEISEGGTGSFKTTLSAVVADYQLLSQKGAANGYAGLDGSQQLLLANFPSGTALQVLRRNAANTALEFADVAAGGGITSINGDTTAAQIIAPTTNRIDVNDVGATHTIDISPSYVGQASITTLGTITTGVWNGTAIAYADLNLTNSIVNADISASAAIQFSKLESLTSSNIIVGSVGNVATAVAMTGDAQISNTGILTIQNDAITTPKILDDNVTYAKIQNVVNDDVFLGRISGVNGIIEELNGTQATSLLNIFTDTLQGVVPLSGGGTTNFLRADGQWEVPPGGGAGITSINADTTAAQILAGTTNRISLVDAGATHTFDIDVAYVGQASITTLGTVTTGVWNGTDILFANIQDIATSSFLGRTTAATGVIEVLTTAQATALLDSFSGTVKGLVPTGSGNDNSLYLDGTGNWTVPPGGSGGITTLNTLTAAVQTFTQQADKILINSAGSAHAFTLGTDVVTIDQSNTYEDFAQTFPDNQLFIQNPLATATYQIIAEAITLNRTATLPLLLSNDTFVFENHIQTLTNKTLTTPTIADFTNAVHDHQDAAGGGTLVATLALTATGTTDNTTFLRGDNTWAVPPGTGGLPVPDTTPIVEGSVDDTKLLRFEIDGFSTLTTRVITPPDADITLVNTSDGLIGTANITDDAVTYAKIQNVVGNLVVLGNISGANGVIEELDGTDVTALLDVFTPSLKGLVPAATGGLSTEYLSADGTFSVPGGTGITTLNTLTAAVQTLSGQTDKILINSVTADHAFTLGTDVVTIDKANVYEAFAQNFGAATSLEIPNSDAPTVNTNGQIAIDNLVTDFDEGVIKYFSVAEMGVVAMPVAQFTSPTDGHVVAYNATDNNFELVAQSGGTGTNETVLKTADETIQSDETPTLDDDLQVTLAIGEYVFEAKLFFDSAVSANFRFNCGGGTGTFTGNYQNADWVGNNGQTLTALATDTTFSTSNDPESIAVYGTISVTAAGTFGIEWAQGSSLALDTTLLKNSLLTVKSTSSGGGGGGSGDMILAATQTVTGPKTFVDDAFLIQNPLGTFEYLFQGGAITVDRTINLPVLTGNRTLAFIDEPQTISALQTFNNDSFRLLPTAGNPSSPLDGQMWYNSTDNKLLAEVNGEINNIATDVSIPFLIDGGGSAITVGIKGDIEVPFDCEILAARLFADQTGSIVIDIWKDTFANYPPDNADSITASAPPTITASNKSEDTTLTGWTTAVTKGDTLRFNVDSVTDIQRVTLSLTVRKT